MCIFKNAATLMCCYHRLYIYFRCPSFPGAHSDRPISKGVVLRDSAWCWRRESSGGEAESVFVCTHPRLGGACGLRGPRPHSSLQCSTCRLGQQREQAGESFHREDSAHSRSDKGKKKKIIIIINLVLLSWFSLFPCLSQSQLAVISNKCSENSCLFLKTEYLKVSLKNNQEFKCRINKLPRLHNKH